MLTPEEIENGKSPRGGYTKAQLAAWGVPWPPPKGWRRALLAGAPVPPPVADRATERASLLDAIAGAGDVVVLRFASHCMARLEASGAVTMDDVRAFAASRGLL